MEHTPWSTSRGAAPRGVMTYVKRGAHHLERFASTSLPVRKDAGIETFERLLQHALSERLVDERVVDMPGSIVGCICFKIYT